MKEQMNGKIFNVLDTLIFRIASEEVKTLLRTKSGFVLLDSFALERMPLEAAGFRTNAKNFHFPESKALQVILVFLLFRFGSQSLRNKIRRFF